MLEREKEIREAEEGESSLGRQTSRLSSKEVTAGQQTFNIMPQPQKHDSILSDRRHGHNGGQSKKMISTVVSAGSDIKHRPSIFKDSTFI